jgi:hypothetical protein
MAAYLRVLRRTLELNASRRRAVSTHTTLPSGNFLGYRLNRLRQWPAEQPPAQASNLGPDTEHAKNTLFRLVA